MGHHTKIKLTSRQAGLRLKSRSRHIRNTLRRMSRWRCAVITGSCVRILLEKDKVGDLNNCALHLRNLWRRWHKGSSYQSSVLLIFVERHVRSFEDDMICFIFFRLWGSKRNLDSTISTSESMCFGESRKCPSALWVFFWIWDLVLMKWKGLEKTGGLFTARRVWRPLAWNICLRKMELLDVWVVGWSEVETFLGFIELRKPEIFVELMKDRAFHHLMKESENFNSHVDSQNQVIISFSTYFCSFFCHTTSKSEKFSQNRNQQALSLHDNFFTRPNQTLWDSNTKSILKEAITNSGYISNQSVLSRETYKWITIFLWMIFIPPIPQKSSTFAKIEHINWKYQDPIEYRIYFHDSISLGLSSKKPLQTEAPKPNFF